MFLQTFIFWQLTFFSKSKSRKYRGMSRRTKGQRTRWNILLTDTHTRICISSYTCIQQITNVCEIEKRYCLRQTLWTVFKRKNWLRMLVFFIRDGNIFLLKFVQKKFQKFICDLLVLGLTFFAFQKTHDLICIVLYIVSSMYVQMFDHHSPCVRSTD